MKNKKISQIELKNIKLSLESRKALRKYDSKINKKQKIYYVTLIEGGNWMIPSNTYEFIGIKTNFEDKLHDFYDIPKNVLIEIDYFDTGILAFEKKIYPKYHK